MPPKRRVPVSKVTSVGKTPTSKVGSYTLPVSNALPVTWFKDLSGRCHVFQWKPRRGLLGKVLNEVVFSTSFYLLFCAMACCVVMI